ncbi:MAG: ParB N-terminal domain-containing protein [Brachybacterium sp.]|uniref:ParB N-terminal domain-containing protein n=1 Tax=Brachybacterium sp. TaxID=1891286 RepID=UPI0026487EF4|nr:ParB N-terminal domain-containing protein [Brachybacterium sp.]MDN5687017.1 ParB N-terminal domain-containing protein [Brachybacterium sp.]
MHDLTVHEMRVADLALLPGNPRQGDIGAVVESMRVNGVYQPIIVNRGTETGRAMEVIAGNHRAQAAQQLGHDTIPAVILDVTDEQAHRIALADNRTSDLATYDTDALVLMLQTLPDLTGTGYDGDDLEDLMRELEPTGLPDEDPTAPAAFPAVVVMFRTEGERDDALATIRDEHEQAQAIAYTPKNQGN